MVPFELRPAQRRLWGVIQAQRAAGKPMRAIILKARKLGFSTLAQGLLIQRATQRAHHNALTVAQDNSTAQELFRIGETMYSQLPEDSELALKPAVVHGRRGREMHFGQPARVERLRGDLGLNSKLQVDTANEFQAGRGFTNHSLHLSEVAFWADSQTKLTSLLNTVPGDDPDTLVLIESTANGYNHFRKLWLDSEDGRSDYAPFFAAWHEDERYSKPFLSGEERAEFEVGSGPWGEDEPHLQEMGVTLGQLKWRRWAIENLAQSDLQLFRQEYPSTPDEAFLSTGRQVFSPFLVKRVRDRCAETDAGARRVLLEVGKTVRRSLRHITVDVPTEVRVREWQERRESPWKLWAQPSGQYVIAVDPAGGAENSSGDTDWSAIQVVDHHSRAQVAEWRSQADPSEVALQAFLAALFFTVPPFRPLLVVETTGGHGDPIAQRVWRDYGWKNMYFRRPVSPQRNERQSDLVGWSTDRGSKPSLESGMAEILRGDDPGVRSLGLASELTTYVRNRAGKTGAEGGAHDDLLMAFMVAQFVAQARPPKRIGSGVVNTATRSTTNEVVGY